VDVALVDRALRAYGEAINLVEPLRLRFWHDRRLTIAQIGLLFTVHQQDRLSVGEIARELQTRPATVTGLVNRLDRAGYVTREVDDVDRRVVRVSLTEPGHGLLEEILADGRAYLHRAFDVLGEERVAVLADLLAELVEASATANDESSEPTTAQRNTGNDE
jgi:DNA-binding MarR family transcriptional regulator